MMNGRTSLLRLPAFRVLAFACVTAALGFSISLATTPDSPLPAARSTAKVASRSFDEPLRFTNPFLLVGSGPQSDPFFFPVGGDTPNDPQGFDLGDVAPGAEITRYVTATGGFLPYRFNAQGLPDPLAGSNAPAFVVPLRLPFGKLNTTIAATAVGALRFNVLLTDFINTTRVGTFKMNVVPFDANTLRFAQDRLPTAQQGRTYFTNLQTVGGTGAVKFQVAENSIVVNNVSFKRLEDTGLTLASDGTLFGRPIQGFDIRFTALAQDSAFHSAFSRDGSAPNQTFTITVEKNLPVQTEIAGVQCAVRGNVPAAGVASTSDMITYSGYIDPKSETAPTLAGTDFTLRVGAAGSASEGVLTGKFDAKGKVRTSVKLNGSKKPTQFQVTVSPQSGRIKIKASNISLGTALGAGGSSFTDFSLQPLILAFEVGNYRTCEVLQAQTRATAGRFSMNYALGKRGFSRAGACQVLALRGVDTPATAKTQGTTWLLRVLGVPAQDKAATPTAPAKGKAPPYAPPTAGSIILAGTKAKIEIGDFSQDITLALKQVRLEFKATSKDAGLFQVLLDPKTFVHRIQTNVLTPDDTGIPQAITTKLPTIFPFAMSITNFNGETSRVIVPDRTVWTPQ